MKKMTIYVACDGTRFDTKKECLDYEKIFVDIEKIINKLKPNDEVSYKVAIKQNIDNVKLVKKEFFLYCAKIISSYKTWFTEVANGTRHISHAGRILSDYSNQYPKLYKAYYRLECINEVSGIEYEQIYYAHHESEFKGIVKD